MKKNTILGAALIATLAGMASASAQVVTSVQFYNYSTGLSQFNGYANANNNYTAGEGAYSVDNYNSYYAAPRAGAGVVVGASNVTSTGDASPVTFSIAYANADNTGNTNANFTPADTAQFYQTTGTANQQLLGSGIGSGGNASSALTLNLDGLTVGDRYTLVAYVSGLFYGGGTDSVSDGTTTYYFDPTTGNYNAASGGLTSYVQATATTADGADPANFVEFTNLMTGDGTLTLTETGAFASLMGFQVVDLGATPPPPPPAVPEPSTVGLMAFGFVGLAVLAYRRRGAQV